MTKRYAVIDENIVTNITLAEEPLFENWIEVNNEVSKGDVFDKITGEFTHQDQPSIKGRERYITVAAFRRRMTLEEKVALKVSNDPVVDVLDTDLSDSTYVDLDLPLLQEGLDYIALNIPPFTVDRVAELLEDGEEHELYKGVL